MAVRPHRRDLDLERFFHAYRGGDEAALGECIQRSRPWLSAVARRLGANPAEFDELVQDTWIAAAQAATDIPDDVPLLPWLASLLHHRLVSLRRVHTRRARLHVLDDEAIAAARSRAPYADAVAIARGREVLRSVQSAIDELPPTYREVLRLHLFEGLTPLEVARQLGIGRVAVRVRLFRGLRALRRALPDTLALLVIAGLASHGRTQVPLWTTAAATVMLATTLAVAASAHLAAPTSAPPDRGAVTIVPALPLATGADTPSSVVERAAETPAPAHLEVAVYDGAGRPVPGVGISVRPGPGGDALLRTVRGATGDDGAARFASLPSGRLVVESDRGGATTVELGAKTERVVLRAPHDAHDVHGIVTDERGTPIAGARIWVASTRDDPLTGADVAATDATGRFALRALPEGTFVAARAPGHRGSPARRVTGTDAGAFVLTSGGGSAVVTVVDLAGNRVPDASVSIGVGSTGATAIVAGRKAPTVPPPFVARADASGEFVADGLPPGPHPVVVRAEGFTPLCTTVVVTADANTPVLARLAPGVRLRGRVIDERGVACPAARLAARTEESFAAVDVTAAADGTFEFAALPAGPITFRVQANDCEAREHRLDLEPGDRVVEFTVAELPRFTGVLQSSLGEPLAGWEATLFRWQAPSYDPGTMFAKADGAGNVVVDRSPGAKWEDLLVRPPGSQLWLRVGEFVTQLADGRFWVSLPPDAMPTAHARIRLLTHTHEPLAGVAVWLRTRDGDDLAIGTSDASGEFEFGPLVTDEYHLVTETTSPALPPCDIPVFSIDNGETKEIEFVAPPTGAVEWSLQFPDGTTPRAPMVTVRDTVRNLPRAHPRTASGRQVLEPGWYTLHAIGDDFVWAWTVPFEVKAGETTHITGATRRAARRTLSLRDVPTDCRGERFAGALTDLASGEVLYKFDVPLDSMVPVPLVSFLPIGRIRLQGTATNGHRVHADFELTDLLPSYSGIPLQFVRDP